jgi:hypothetical protein
MLARRATLSVDALPPLPLDGWRPTKETLHRVLQIVGKIRLEHAPYGNHWWHAPLHVTPRGLRAPHMVAGDRSFEITLDLVAHEVAVATSAGDRAAVALADGLPIAAFYGRLLAALAAVGVVVDLANPRPWDLGDDRPFAADAEHAAYDAAWVDRYRRILVWVDHVFRLGAGTFSGKTSPVHLFWHGFDLAMTRFSGRPAPVPAGADLLTREGYSHEVISFGFWPGDAKVTFPAFYAYAAPSPAGLADHPLRPTGAVWQANGMALLPYEDVRAADDPQAALLAFLDSAYAAGATAAGWEAEALRIPLATWRAAAHEPAR